MAFREFQALFTTEFRAASSRAQEQKPDNVKTAVQKALQNGESEDVTSYVSTALRKVR